jgi:hypothetical protein
VRVVLDVGESRRAVSEKTPIPFSAGKRHARALGYEPRLSLGKPRATAWQNIT